MRQILDKLKAYLKTVQFKKIIKRVVYSCIGLLAFILISFIGLRIYFDQNKTKIVAQINTEINKNITGKISIGDVGYKFLVGFPNFTLVLNQVELKDSLFAIHKRTLLKASEIEVRLNVLSLINNEVNIHKMVINDATIDLYKDKNGISNSNIFKPKKNKTKSNSTTSIDEITLNKVNFISENIKGNKKFYFEIASLKSEIKYSANGWKTELRLKTFAKSMAFNTRKGSFIKDKKLQGVLAVDFSKEQNVINVLTKNLEIGEDFFYIKAHFNVGKTNSLFGIDIKTSILWSNAYKLLSNNISDKLNKFDLKKPIKVGCTINGDMNVMGDPEIVVIAEIKDNELMVLKNTILDCSFIGKFTNNYKDGAGYNDANSAIVITNFLGTYKEIPLKIPDLTIANLEKPIANGKLISSFETIKMNELLSKKQIKFTHGAVNVDLAFEMNLEDIKKNKPVLKGEIAIKNAVISYEPKKAILKKVTIQLIFSERMLLIKNGFIEGKLGGTLAFDGQVTPKENSYFFKTNVKIKNADITQFLSLFNNFGIKSFAPNNIQGKLFTTASVAGTFDSKGNLLKNTISGIVDFNVNKGALINFGPIKNVGKFAFPLRNVSHITFSDLSANLKVRGQMMDIHNLKVSSSVLNLDVNGVYGLKKGTNLAVTIPLRNSKKDAEIIDKKSRDERRNKGIVLHLLAVDENGKIKIKFDKNHEKTKK